MLAPRACQQQAGGHRETAWDPRWWVAHWSFDSVLTLERAAHAIGSLVAATLG